jgi:Sigma-54 interaction domain
VSQNRKAKSGDETTVAYRDSAVLHRDRTRLKVVSGLHYVKAHDYDTATRRIVAATLCSDEVNCRVEPLARIELGNGAPAEVIRLLPLVGLEPVLGSGAASPLAVSRSDALPLAPAVALRVAFGRRCAETAGTGDREDTSGAPATLTIALETTALDEDWTADLVTDSAVAAVCFIFSRALGLGSPFLTADPHLFDVIRAAAAVAGGPARILVEGELGVGKESLIKLIHAASRDPAELVHAERAGLEADALEAEFAPLLMQAANSSSGQPRAGGGAIFFNRIGELSPAAQRKLLDLLRAFAPVAPDRRHTSASGMGPDSRAAIAKVRMLAASTRLFGAPVADSGLLPELHDLFDATLTISPLRARRGDLPLLVRHYLRGLNPALTLNGAALRALSVYPFPGNMLELTNFVTRVAIIPPRAGSRLCPTAHAATRIVGRAEVIGQLDRGSLNTVWRSRDQRDSRRTLRLRRGIVAPTVKSGDDEAAASGASLLAVPALASPALLRLTTGTVPRLRKPRGGGRRPRA